MKWTNEELILLKTYYGVIPISQIIIEHLTNRTRNSVKQKAVSLGLIGNRSAMTKISKTLYHCKEDAFNNDDLCVFYWAGFLAADGCITKDNRVQLGVAIKDIDHLRRFMDFIEYTGKITYSPDGSFCMVRIRGSRMIDDLSSKFNITPRKSLTLLPPTSIQNEKDRLAFIAGYIDGDGCIHVSSAGRPELSCLGTLEVITWIRDILIPESDKNIDKRNNIYRFKTSGTKANAIMSEIKKLNLPLLQRKWYKQWK